MAEFKLVISHKDGKSEQKVVKDAQAKPFLGKKIGDAVKGDAFDMPGFEFEVRGGSDRCGFPMRKDFPGTTRKRILAVSGVGLKKKRAGQRQRKTVCGNTVHGDISQINLKVTKVGKVAKPDEKAEGVAKPEAKPEAKPDAKEEKKEDKPEAKPDAKEEKKEDKPEAKPEAKEEKKEDKPEAKPEAKPDAKEEKKEDKPEAKPEEKKE